MFWLTVPAPEWILIPPSILVLLNKAKLAVVPLFAAAFTAMTNGYIPTLIKSDTLPLDRQDIFGTIFEHKDESIVRKVIPIKVVKEITGTVDDVPVYGKSRVEE